jgi:hypothetical protein
MKIIKYPLFVIMLLSSLSAQDIDESLIDKVKKLSETLLTGYSQPLVTAFGTAMGTGLFHSAYSHDFLGFDFGIRVMYIQIPNSAKYFNGTALVCSLGANDELVSYEVDLDNINTIFGPKDRTYVPVTGNAVGIPPYIPGGFDLSAVPFVMPQLNVGLPGGFEIGVRYLPFAITYPLTQEGIEDVNIYFLGVGAKLGIQQLPFLKNVPFPLAIALAGAYQIAGVKDSRGANIINTSTWNFQILASKRLVIVEPFVGAGIEWTTVNFRYDFEYEIPDTINNIPSNVINELAHIDLTIKGQNNYRAMLGFTFYLGPIYLHYDYNILPYKTHNGIIGITLR